MRDKLGRVLDVMRPSATPRREELVAELERRGADAAFVARLAGRLDSLPEELSRDAFEAVLRGLELACTLHREGLEDLRRCHRNLGDLEQLLPVFSGELRKLDEALQILNAFMQRLSDRGADTGESVLH